MFQNSNKIARTSFQAKELPELYIQLDESVQRFTDIEALTPIPSNRIIDKVLPGLGATHSEIVAARNSILVLPNVATIKSKHSKHKDTDNTFAVYEDVTTDELRTYIKSVTAFKKILTTPEGFKKVKSVLGLKMYDDYFLLLDECHKLIVDTHYRKEIVLPMDDFFLFKGKAMISSTVIVPSDTRFMKHKFKLLTLVPYEANRLPLTVLWTNNTLHHLLIEISSSGSKPLAIFFNSIAGITEILEQLIVMHGAEAVHDDYRIYCSKESARNLRERGYKEAYDMFIGLSKYNFFTSSFYNGVDIDYPGYNIDLIMVSDMKFADYTAIDPFSDARQIRGRFRQEQGVEWVDNFKHIVRSDRKRSYLTQADAKSKLITSEQLYKYIANYQFSSGDKIDLQPILERVSPYAGVLDPDGKYNSYRRDNYLYREGVNSYYRSIDALLEQYVRADRFDYTFESFNYRERGLEKLVQTGGKYSPESYRAVTDSLFELEAEAGQPRNALELRGYLEHYELIVKAYFDLGIETLLDLQFEHKLIMKVLLYREFLIGVNLLAVIDSVHLEFRVNATYTREETKTRLQAIFDGFKIKHKVIASIDIRRYFEVVECQKNRNRAYRIVRSIHRGAYRRT